jgi:hypothetical protein
LGELNDVHGGSGDASAKYRETQGNSHRLESIGNG